MKFLLHAVTLISLSGAAMAAYADNDPILAEVNGVKITATAFQSELSELKPELKEMVATSEGRQEMLDTMVLREMVLQEAKKEGMDKDPAIELKLQDLKNRLIVETFLKKKIEVAATLNETEMLKYYNQNKEKFTVPNQIRLSHILVDDEAVAAGIASKIKQGESFEELAKKHSTDSSGVNGGDVGWVSPGEIHPAVESAAFALEENQASAVIKTDAGYHIVKVTGKRKNYLYPFEEVKDQVKEALLPEKQRELFQNLKAELKKKFTPSTNYQALETLFTK